MITLSEIAEKIESGLNAIIEDENLQFHIWASAGELEKYLVRTGNTVKGIIPANLRSVSSANDSNIIVMGSNGLMLDIAIPIKSIKTKADQTAEDLDKIKNGQYVFLDEIKEVIDSYFQLYKVFEYEENGVSYTFSMEGGRLTDDTVDIYPGLDECLFVSVYISLIFLQGGINARNVNISIDDEQVPFSNITIGRSNRLSSDVYNTVPVTKNIATSSALSIDFSFPANADKSTQQAFLSLLGGKPNIVHFIEIDIGSVYDGKYLMIFENLNMNAQGVLFAGINGSLIEAADNLSVIDTPDYMQVGKFTLSDSSTEELTFSATGKAYIAGKIRDLNGAATITLSPSDFAYSESDNVYYVYMISLAAMSVTKSSATFTVVKEAEPNG